jgi:hypothetical protein
MILSTLTNHCFSFIILFFPVNSIDIGQQTDLGLTQTCHYLKDQLHLGFVFKLANVTCNLAEKMYNTVY